MAPEQDDLTTPGPDVAAWFSEIDRAQKDMDEWTKRCNAIRNRYRYEKSKNAARRRYQILWSNLETMRPAVYAKCPVPMVRDRFKTGDPVARIVSELEERTLSFEFEQCKYDRTFRQVRDDFLSYARGTARFVYEPVWDTAEIDDGQEEDGKPDQAPPADILGMENIRLMFVQRDDFIHPKGRTWEELPWLDFRSFMTREELVKRFGAKKGKEVPLNSTTSKRDGDGDQTSRNAPSDKGEIHEIWDKSRRRVLWIARGYAEVLEDSDPYLKVDGYFPCPRPVYGTITNDSLEPVPDFVYYQDQAEEIDALTARIASLTESLKLVGFYPAGPQGEGSPEIEKAVRPGFENRMVAVKSWAAFTEGGKGGAPIVWLPVQQVATVIKECIELRKQLLDDVYQITGISDIMRGDTDANETAAAQGLKSHWGSSRMRERQQEMARFARDATVMAGEIIAGHFQLATMMKISNITLPTNDDVNMAMAQYRLQVQQQQQQAAMMAQQPQGGPPGTPGMGAPPQAAAPPAPPPPPDLGPTQETVEAMLRDGVTRRFRLDIETDSTIAPDDQLERKSRTDFITATSQFVVAWMPIIQAEPEAIDLASALMQFGARGFPAARELEDVIEKFCDRIKEKANQPKPPPQPSPEDQANIAIAQSRAQSEQAKSQSVVQTTQIKTQAEVAKANAGIEGAKIQSAAEVQKANMGLIAAHQEHQHDIASIGLEHASAVAQEGMKQKTLEQQMALQEQKMVARDALNVFKPHPGGPAQ